MQSALPVCAIEAGYGRRLFVSTVDTVSPQRRKKRKVTCLPKPVNVDSKHLYKLD
jgi:hypothetical protein